MRVLKKTRLAGRQRITTKFVFPGLRGKQFGAKINNAVKVRGRR